MVIMVTVTHSDPSAADSQSLLCVVDIDLGHRYRAGALDRLLSQDQLIAHTGLKRSGWV